ncbi:MAG: hypothetical protein KGO98_05560, partial [Rickettsiales bacterium]|nr:hypothetical protein [Rickettsiales bacterium]
RTYGGVRGSARKGSLYSISTSNCRKITRQTFYKIIDKAINCGKIFFHRSFLVSKKHKITYIPLKI